MLEDRPFHERYKGWLKAISIICGLLLLALAGQNFGSLSVQSPTDVILPAYYIVFAIFIISAEFGLSCVINYFRFIEGFTGRGLFYMFVGTLCLRSQFIFEVVVAAVIFFIGALYLCCFCGANKKKTQVEAESDPSEASHPQV